LIPSTPSRYIHEALQPWKRPPLALVEGRPVLWHTLWSESYSNPRYAELVPRLERLFFAPIRQRAGLLGRVDGVVARRVPFIERRTLAWYRRAGISLLLTPNLAQLELFDGPAVVDLDDPLISGPEQAALRARTVRHVIVTTEETCQYVQASNPSLDVTVIPQGVDLERAAAARHDEVRRQILTRGGLPLDAVIVGYHAPFVCLSEDRERKDENLRTFDVDVLLSAVRRLWSDGMSFATVLVGNPSSSIEKLARTEKRLVLAGYVERDRLFDWVGAFDVGTYPRTLDFGGRQSVKLLEYMANSAAIAAMRTHETRFLEDAGTGYVAGDPAEFSAVLRRLIASRHERLSLVDRARVAVMEHDWRTLAARYDHVLAAVASDE
jgi:glycosyltransferase involved in cell wall biosynthesis